MVVRQLLFIPFIVIAWAAAAGAVVAAGAENPLRSLVVLPFLLVIPGLALVPFLRIGGLPALTLAIGLSLALDAVVPTTMIYAGSWSPEATLVILLVLSLVGGAGQIVLALRGPATATEQMR